MEGEEDKMIIGRIHNQEKVILKLVCLSNISNELDVVDTSGGLLLKQQGQCWSYLLILAVLSSNY